MSRGRSVRGGGEVGRWGGERALGHIDEGFAIRVVLGLGDGAGGGDGGGVEGGGGGAWELQQRHGSL